MKIAFTHRISWQNYKKWLLQTYYLNNKKRLYSYFSMMLGGVLLIVFKLVNAFGLSDRYPEETLYIVGGSLIITPLFFYRAVIRNSKKYYHSNSVFGSEINYVFDLEKISYETYDGNTGACLWKNVKTIEEDNNFIRIILPDNAAFLIVKNSLDNNILNRFQQLLHEIKVFKR